MARDAWLHVEQQVGLVEDNVDGRLARSGIGVAPASPQEVPVGGLAAHVAQEQLVVQPLGQRDGRVHLPLESSVNGKPFGRPDAGSDMTFGFDELIAHAAKTRRLGAGCIVGSGTVSNKQGTDHGSALADGGGHPLHRLGADVARDEDPGQARLQQPGVPVEGPPVRAAPVVEQPRPGGDEAPLVADDDPVQPVRARLAADEDEQVAGVVGGPLPGPRVLQRHLLEVAVAHGPAVLTKALERSDVTALLLGLLCTPNLAEAQPAALQGFYGAMLPIASVSETPCVPFALDPRHRGWRACGRPPPSAAVRRAPNGRRLSRRICAGGRC